jgi:protoheme IX farnesyltransferase
MTSLSALWGSGHLIHARLVAATGDFGIEGKIIFNSVFWHSAFWAIDGSYEDYEKQVFMLPTGKKIRVPVFAFYITVWLIIAPLYSLLGIQVSIYIPAAAVFYWHLDVVLCSRLYKLRTAKAAKTLMLVSVGILLVTLVYIIDKF